MEDNEGLGPLSDVADDVALDADEPLPARPETRLGCPICGLPACGHNLPLVEVLA